MRIISVEQGGADKVVNATEHALALADPGDAVCRLPMPIAYAALPLLIAPRASYEPSAALCRAPQVFVHGPFTTTMNTPLSQYTASQQLLMVSAGVATTEAVSNSNLSFTVIPAATGYMKQPIAALAQAADDIDSGAAADVDPRCPRGACKSALVLGVVQVDTARRGVPHMARGGCGVEAVALFGR